MEGIISRDLQNIYSERSIEQVSPMLI